ncbi:MAG: ClbS/DfsB family four-helix bundle protein [Chloroflexota bacterium]
MPEPKTKGRVITRLNTERRRLEKNLAVLAPEQISQPDAVGKYAIKDVLAHLAEWESFMPDWVEAARRGEDVQEPDWKKIDDLNEHIYQNHKGQSLDEVLAYFRNTHRAFMAMAEAMPEDEMLTPGRYAFLGGGAIWDWLNAYAAHDLWGKKHIIRWIKELQKDTETHA